MADTDSSASLPAPSAPGTGGGPLGGPSLPLSVEACGRSAAGHIPEGAGAARVGLGIPRRLRAAGPGPSLPPTEAQAPSETTLANVTGRAEAVLSGRVGNLSPRRRPSDSAAGLDKLSPRWRWRPCYRIPTGSWPSACPPPQPLS